MKLAEWLDNSCMTGKQAAEWLGISYEHLYRLKSGRHTPSLNLAMKIHRLTNGQVSYDDWPIAVVGHVD